MQSSMVIQGRQLRDADIEQVRSLIRNNPSWHRTRLSKELCALWDWRAANGQIKDMACRSLLRTLHQRDLIQLPVRCSHGKSRQRKTIPDVFHLTDPIETSLQSLQPLRFINIRHDPQYADLYACLLHRYHYLRYSGPVGENMRYLMLDRADRPIAALLFGAAAWKCAPRDHYIGWTAEQRKRYLPFLVNNQRFVVLPWVHVKCLASTILAQGLKRLSADWLLHYHHRVDMVESFVDRSRFKGTCYKAANWIRVGCTQGRSRQDRHRQLNVPVKDIYLRPLRRDFRKTLCASSSSC